MSFTPLDPAYAAELHPTLNGENFNPETIAAGSNKNYWWTCPQGHDYQAIPNNRTRRGSGCPYCAGKAVLKGFNDLATTHPQIAAQWHTERNGDHSPTQYSAGSKKKFWWTNTCGHEWEASVQKRVVGRGCPYCSGHKTNANTSFLVKYPELLAEWHPTKNLPLLPTEVSKASAIQAWWQCNNCRYEWQAAVYNRAKLNGTACPECNQKRYTSKAETELQNFFTTLGLKVITKNKTILKGKELDIYLPELNLAVEFNGLFWHNEFAGKGKNYHRDKWLAAKEAGIQLIQIWEDDWVSRKNIVLRTLAYKTNKMNQLAEHFPIYQKNNQIVYARKTQIAILSTSEAQQFFQENHIQGFAAASYYLGLAKEDTIVAAIAIKRRSAASYEIIRYATQEQVVGGFTKLLQHFKKVYMSEEIYTFADHTLSDGGLYENNGFIKEKELEPDYMYVYRDQRKHKFGYRLKRFRDDPTLQWVEGLSERELALLNKLPRIWDAGKTKYVLK